ncbi:mucin-19-like [Galendromus occidentalis]|uniref:Store-operated calcium entry-associated regulatory factor n=1 Tax=Galendromus occidentalis TaxID=34638 RepID=A0AAJ6QMN3_9ACAR|nr:mucin-19-like [Galendromus occidentalis]
MKLLPWLILPILVAESLQKAITEADSTSLGTSDVPEGSGGNSDPSSEEQTVTAADLPDFPLKVKKIISLSILPPDESAASSSAESSEEERKTIIGTPTVARENSVYPNPSDPALEILGENPGSTAEDSDLDKSLTMTSASVAYAPQLSAIFLANGKIQSDIEDTVTLSPPSRDSHDEGGQAPDQDMPLAKGKSEASPQEHRGTDTGDEPGDTISDGKNGRTITRSHHDSAETLRENLSASTAASAKEPDEPPATALSEISSLVPSQESSSILEHSTASPIEASTGAILIERSTTMQAIDSSPAEAAGSSSSPESASSVIPSSTTDHPPTSGASASPSSVVTDSSGTTEYPPKPGPRVENVDNSTRFVFQKGARTTCVSAQACSARRDQLQCIGEFCETLIKTVTCNRAGDSNASTETSFGRYTLPVQWTCGSSDFEPDFRISEAKVVCEGFKYPGDKWIVKNSCSLLFHLDRSNIPPLISVEVKEADAPKASVLAIVLTLLVVCGMTYLLIKVVILKRRHGLWIPSYCALPLKARMNFRREEHTDYDEEPVNVHFDLNEEQTSIGRHRNGSYGLQ